MGFPSYAFGRIGSIDSETGLFALEGSTEAFKISYDTITNVGSTRDGYEINSRVPFEDGMKNPDVVFFNKAEGYATKWKTFQAMVDVLHGGSVSDIASGDTSLIFNHNTTKIKDRRYLNEFLGMFPRERAIKAILKNRGVATKRVILFGCSVHPDYGGATWVVSPTGFPWRDTGRNIIEDGTDEDIVECMAAKNFMFMTVTAGVPFISGHRMKQPDEQWPRVLRIPPCKDTYLNLLDIQLMNTLPGSTSYMGSSLSFMQQLYAQAVAEGKKIITSEDLMGDTIDLDDCDLMI